MGEVIDLHARASAGSAAAKASKVMSARPFSPAKRTKAGQRCAGMPLARQVLTVLAGTPRAAETAVVPPNASIAESGVSDIGATIIRTLRTSQGFANCEATFSGAAASILDMADALTLQSRRLKAVREACGKKPQQEFAKEIGVGKSNWADFENGKRHLTLLAARKLKVRHKLPLDFTLDGDLVALDLAPARLERALKALIA